MCPLHTLSITNRCCHYSTLFFLCKKEEGRGERPEQRLQQSNFPLQACLSPLQARSGDLWCFLWPPSSQVFMHIHACIIPCLRIVMSSGAPYVYCLSGWTEHLNWDTLFSFALLFLLLLVFFERSKSLLTRGDRFSDCGNTGSPAVVLPHDRMRGFYSAYFLVPKKTGDI